MNICVHETVLPWLRGTCIYIPGAVIKPTVDKYWELCSMFRYSKKKWGKYTIFFVMFHYHCGLILWKFGKVSVINTEIVDILRKAMTIVLRWDKEFWRDGGAAITNQILYRARYDSVQTRDLLLIKAKWVGKNCFKKYSLSFAQTHNR
jgi:hypothetical protein